MSQEQIEDFSNTLHDLFVMNPTRYASQQSNGGYKTINQNLTPAVIKQMLNLGESLLTYQECQGFMRWVCLDFDIKKGFDSDSDSNQNQLISTIQDAARKLDSYQIPYLTECSGNRGFHLWVIFDNEIDKQTAFSFINKIKTSLNKIPDSVGIDLFPKTSIYNPKAKGIGLGVKLPLSKHKKSDKHSFFISKIENISFDKKNWPKSITSSFLMDQIEILKSYKPFDSELIKAAFDSNEKSKLNIKTVNINTTVDYELDDLLHELSKCYCVASILKNYRSNLSHTNRLILVGLLARISSSNNPNLGMELLDSFFSRLSNYDQEQTSTRLKDLKNLYPQSCDTLKNKLSINCQGCICERKNTPLEVLKGVEIKYSFDGFQVSNELFDFVKLSQINYINSNDEVSIHHLKASISSANYLSYNDEFNKLFTGKLEPRHEKYKFVRYESESKNRTLVSLSSQDKIISTASLSLLNEVWFDTFSNNSFGYRVNPSLSKGWIFENWLVKWNLFVKNIKSIIYDEMKSYDNYQVIKIDLKSFYDKINHQKLRIKLLDQPISPIIDRLEQFSSQDKVKYENIINYLLLLTKSTNPKIGVPQGPAYARFLAEIYLLGLDQLIESSIKRGFEFYFRFVDDIFIFVEDKEKSEKIYQDISDWVNLNELEVNTSKSLVTTVEYFKKTNSIMAYENDSKYTINKLMDQKSSLSKKELNSAVVQAKGLLNDSKFGLKDNFRFVLSKFSSNDELKYEKSTIEPLILNSKFGRGSLYKTFFSSYYFKKKDMNLISNQELMGLNSLAREVYLNEILDVIESLDQTKLTKHVEDLLSIKSPSSIELISIFQILLKLKIDIPKGYLNNIPTDIIESILFSGEKHVLTLSLLNDEFYSKLFPSELSPFDFVSKTGFLVEKNILGIDELRSLSTYFWNRLSEDNYKLFRLNEYQKNHTTFYNIIALFTITINEFTSFKAQLRKVWSDFLKYVDKNKVEIKNHYWFKFIDPDEFKKLTKSTVVSCITLNKEQGLVDDCPDYSNIMQRYRDIILAIYNDCLTDEFELDNELIESLRQNDKFIDWVYDHSAKMYPDTDICLSNIALNNLIVMNKDTSFLVKNLNGNLRQFEHIDTNDSQGVCDTLIFEVGHNYKEVKSKFDNMSSLKTVSLVKNLYDFGIEFKDNNSTLGYPNYFMCQSRVNENWLPSIPYYADAEYLFPSGQSKHENDHEGFCSLILDLIYSFNLELFNDASSYNFYINATNATKIFPSSANSSSQKVNFLFSLIENLDLNKFYIHAHAFEFAWAQALFDTTEDNKNLTKYLANYLDHHEKNNRSENYRLYTLILSPNKKAKNLDFRDFILVLKDNILITGVQKILLSEYSSVIACVEDQFSCSKVNFIFSTVNIFESDEFSSKPNKILSLNSVDYDLDDNKFSYYLIDMDESISLRTLNLSQFETISSRGLVYSTMVGNNLVILLPPRTYEKVYEIMDHRARWLESENLGIEKLKLLNNFEHTINLASLSITKASKVIAQHYWHKDINIVCNRVLNWLLLFNQSSIKGSALQAFMDKKGYTLQFLYESILDVVDKHTCIDQENIVSFKDKLELSIKNNDIFFTLKNINNDKNGLQHLIQICGADKLRTLDLEDCFNNIANLENTNKNITILCDVGISGTEFKKALRFYFKNSIFENNQETLLTPARHALTVEKECYFDYNPEDIKNWDSFKKNFMASPTIRIMTAMSTSKFEAKVKNTIKILADELSLPEPLVIFDSNLLLEKYNFEHFSPNLNYKKKELFSILINDVTLLEKIFDDNWSYYKNSIRGNKIANSNLILRLESTPKGRFRLFTMKSKDGELSLFDRRLEHNESK
ncbi:Reverse transcriptase domain-containing protein [Vibrio chagasii]|nr:Reverse transcriptase domain-containing protein [Vibrio chagasii]CAH7228417.1 Reverse transcriptase domain-containing protein [Vibrio chagasii]CAH7254767.1 Reverse transcriptase domain-containing protein [Vibrio chagasii]CAH7394448.1 Reverse transcriptase domain-containing protein [Vibrio chagasii]CAH7467118.1 Reverse transcriptase domain-containing protein [Vibrio chagasii]